MNPTLLRVSAVVPLFVNMTFLGADAPPTGVVAKPRAVGNRVTAVPPPVSAAV